MNSVVDYERLMLDALDGTLTEAERSLLNDYLKRHEQEQAIFERMQNMDLVLRREPPLTPPSQLQQNVMNRVTRVAASRHPYLKGSQIVFIIGIFSLLLSFMSGLLLAFYLSISPTFPLPELQGAIAFVRVVMDITAGLMSATIAVIRAVLSQTVAWFVLVGLLAIVAGWVRVIAAIYFPRAVPGGISVS